MPDIITGPGKYTIKFLGPGRNFVAEVVDVRSNMAIGWCHSNPRSWNARTGVCLDDHSEEIDITGPYIEPPKPEELWIAEVANGQAYRIEGSPFEGARLFREVL